MNPRSLLTSLALFTVFSGPAFATEFFVTTTADEPYDGGDFVSETTDGSGLSLREIVGIFNANGGAPLGGENDGDIVRIHERLFDPTAPVITLATEIVVSDDLVVDGAGPNGQSRAILDAGGTSRHFRVAAGDAPGSNRVSLANLMLRNGSEDLASGGALRIGAGDVVTLQSILIRDCSASSGGAIFNDGGTLTITSCEVRENTANGRPDGSGGAILNGPNGIITIEGTSFLDNVANRAGGALEDQSGGADDFSITLSSVLLSGNRAGTAPATPSPGSGGALHITGTGSVRAVECIATGNSAATQGGAFWNDRGVLELVACNLNNNTAEGASAEDGGGGIYNKEGGLTLTSTSVLSNDATGTLGGGGGVFSRAGEVSMTSSIVASNTSNRAGGGIEIRDGTIRLVDVALGGDVSAAGNVAGFPGSATPGDGGGLHLSGQAVATIEGGSIASNVAEHQGGGLWIGSEGSVTISASADIADNLALGSDESDGGGGIYNDGGVLTITDTGGAVRILRNEAAGTAGSGGGIFNLTGGTLTISGATIEANRAQQGGGGITDGSGAATRVTLNNVALLGNEAISAVASGGGLDVTGPGEVEILGGEISGNMAGRNGGGLMNHGGSITLLGTAFRENLALGAAGTEGGGAIFNRGGDMEILAGTEVEGNEARGTLGSGGGIFNDSGGSVVVELATISNNRAERAGGGIEDNSGPGLGITLIGAKLEGNDAVGMPGHGGGLHVTGEGSVRVTGGSISENTAAGLGGGLAQETGTLTVSGATIEDNRAGPGGGAISNDGGALEISATSMRHNRCNADGSTGGAIHSLRGAVTIVDSSIAANRAENAGGGIFFQDGSMSLRSVSLGGSREEDGNFTNQIGSGGGALYASGAATIDIWGGSVSWNAASGDGGGLWLGERVSTTLEGGTVVADNSARSPALDGRGGGIFNQGGTLKILPSSGAVQITGNRAAHGGGLYNGDRASSLLNGVVISRNHAERTGGGIEDVSGSGYRLQLQGVSVLANRAGNQLGHGGGAYLAGEGEVIFFDCEVSGNHAEQEGGGIWSKDGKLSVHACSLTSNSVQNAGGGVYNLSGDLLITDTSFHENLSLGGDGRGGAIFSGGLLNAMRTTFTGNLATEAGGALQILGSANNRLESCRISQNVAGPEPGAIRGTGGAVDLGPGASLTVKFCWLDRNRAASNGGACATAEAARLTFHSCAVTHNEAMEGGAIHLADPETWCVITNSTLSNNSAAKGGAIAILEGRLNLVHATVAANDATTSGGGIHHTAGIVEAQHTVVGLNNAPSSPDVRGHIASVSFCLLQNPSGSSGIEDGQGGNLVGLDPDLAPLGDYGGTTPAHLPRSHSPLLDAGDAAPSTPLSLDQRGPGFPRTLGPQVDIGSVEGGELTFARWTESAFTEATPVDQRDPEDDPEGDGIPNGIEWLTGLNPEAANTNPIAISTAGETISLTYPRGKTILGEVETLEMSADLRVFTPLPSADRIITPSQTLFEMVTLRAPREEAPRLFLRLRVAPE